MGAHQEPLGTTIKRTFGIAIVAGGVLSLGMRHDLKLWPLAALVMLWPSLGGHYVEAWYLDRMRPHLSERSRTITRIFVWFAAGCFFAWAMHLTAASIGGSGRTFWPAWWIGGLAFIGIELIAHAGLQARQRPSFYNGLG